MYRQPKEQSMSNAFEKAFSERGFWDKVLKYAKAAGYEVIEKALWLYYAAQSPQTPVWAKTTIYGALGYFIFPLDAIPDLAPVLGYSDDLGVLTAAVVAVAVHITADIKARSTQQLKDWFG
jgi:uncharacterized membrane protein YkvA (DUF1232 family)